ncbi:MAG: hypothetical protein ABI376_05915 [Caulobacteraceae bacterium]
MKRLHPMRTCALVLGAAVAVAAGACLLPENPYQRWQLLDGTIHANARWIYERSTFDPAPVDVAVVGPSRTGAGVNAPRLQRDLAGRGIVANVVNFSLPESGRNINEAVVATLLARKRPTLLVIGVTEQPARRGHSAFKFVAPRGMIADPGYWTDVNYFSDLVYLPFRQMRLFLADVAPRAAGLTKTFDPAAYRGSSIDTTGSVVLPGGAVKEGEKPASAAELARGVGKLERGMHPPLLPARDADLEFGDERHNIRRIVTLAHARGVKVAFLFLPFYSGPGTIEEQRFYEQFGPVWNAGWLSPHAEWYADYGHLTRTGAEHLTDWLAGPVAAALQSSDPPRRAPA